MKIETIGSFLPDESLISARLDFENGKINRQHLTTIEDEAVRDIIERQIDCGLPFITSGELRRKHWANDFWFGLDGISCENISSGHLYQPVEVSTDVMHISGRIGFNPAHPFFADFRFLHDTVAGRASCRQTLPSPANLLLEIYSIAGGAIHAIYPSTDSLIYDIAEAYRLTAKRFYELGCDSLLYDDTALGLMCDDNYTKRILQGGINLIELHRDLIRVINSSIQGVPNEMEKSIYITGGDNVVPEWEHIDYPDNIMPKALAELNMDKFFMPLDPDNDYAIKVLRHIPQGKSVVVGLGDAHTPFTDNVDAAMAMVDKITRTIEPSRLAISPRTGFKLSSYSQRALLYEDQWRKIKELKNAFR